MSLIKSNRNNSISKFPRLFDDFISRDFFDWGTSNFSKPNSSLPSVNIVESNDAFELEMAAPGMSKEDFNIELDNEVLKVSANKEESNNDNRNSYVRREYSYHSFQRTFVLPRKVLEDSRIEATYKDGVLKVIIPKKEEAKALPPRTIEIR